MSDNQNNQNQNNAIKPSVHKLNLNNLKIQRPQTEGYEKDENIESTLKPLTATNTTASKPTLNLGASSYIPKSMGGSTNAAAASENKGNANTATTTTNNQTVLNTNTQPFQPKMNYNSTVPNQQSNMPLNQPYPMGQSKVIKL